MYHRVCIMRGRAYPTLGGIQLKIHTLLFVDPSVTTRELTTSKNSWKSVVACSTNLVNYKLVLYLLPRKWNSYLYKTSLLFCVYLTTAANLSPANALPYIFPSQPRSAPVWPYLQATLFHCKHVIRLWGYHPIKDSSGTILSHQWTSRKLRHGPSLRDPTEYVPLYLLHGHRRRL